MAMKPKKRGFDLSVKTFTGKGRTYLVFRTANGAYHAFVEVEAKQAARECGNPPGRTTRQMWDSIWNETPVLPG